MERVDELLDGWEENEGGWAELIEALEDAYGPADVEPCDAMRRLVGSSGHAGDVKRRHFARLRRAGAHVDVDDLLKRVTTTLGYMVGVAAPGDKIDGPALFTLAVERMVASGAVKDGLDVHTQIMVNNERIPAYERTCSLRNFVYNLGSEGELFEAAHSGKGVLEDLYKKMLHMTKVVPTLKVSRLHHAWRNGVVDVRTGELSDFDELEEGVFACTFHDMEYTPAPSTPLFDGVLHAQGISGSVHTAFMALAVGRMLHDPQVDNWQRLVFLTGAAGTGKSLMVNVISDLVGRSVDVSSNAEPRWIGGQVHDAYLLTCGDMTSTCTWPKSIVLQMTGDRSYQMERKYQDPIRAKSTNHILIAGNSALPFVDVAGEVERRVIPFVMSTPVVPNPALGRQLRGEYAGIFQQACEAYTSVCEWMEDEDLTLNDVLFGCGATQACTCHRCANRQGPYFTQSMRVAVDHS